jgi:hypothetical protein
VDQTTNRIKQHIDTEREQLGRNFDEIGNRVKRATDLKGHFDRNTGWILGAAVAGGFLLSLACGKSSTPVTTPDWESDSQAPSANIAVHAKSPFATHFRKVSDTVENIVGGLIGVASYKLHSFVADAVPGFREQYDAIERQRDSSLTELGHAKG